MGLALLRGSVASAQDARCTAHLFVLARNKNANIVVYDAKQTAHGALAAKKPVDAHWLLGGENGKRQALNAIEWNRAYGFDIAPGADAGTFTMRLHADRKRPLAISVRGGCPVAIADIGGRRGILRRIFIQAVEGGGIVPRVEYIELFGEDGDSGEALYEKFVPGK